MTREIPFKESAICDNCGAEGAFDFMGDYLCGACSEAAASDAEDFGPEYGEYKIYAMSGGASDHGVGGLISVSSLDSNGKRWTRNFLAVGEWTTDNLSKERD
jgi:hypothetical protein